MPEGSSHPDAWTSKAPAVLSRVLGQGQDGAKVGRRRGEVDLPAGEAAQDAVCPVGAEHPVRFPQRSERVGDGCRRAGFGGFGASQMNADRQPHDHLGPGPPGELQSDVLSHDRVPII